MQLPKQRTPAATTCGKSTVLKEQQAREYPMKLLDIRDSAGGLHDWFHSGEAKSSTLHTPGNMLQLLHYDCEIPTALI
ncbi:hypothetical protein T265_01662 [Opisthorchis viverrini]|uniref:Uncharacterized protein n=1 Tax=Opisthorchis viverrini TaxID=6198 RepID=A0A075A937_OPIVI|nr:hypothetical protein T265_01662 [Opisthorchis viverrini]KER32230.1 hypothetical protein T265_01662 [Opisthorchis viverrini]